MQKGIKKSGRRTETIQAQAPNNFIQSRLYEVEGGGTNKRGRENELEMRLHVLSMMYDYDVTMTTVKR